MREDSKELNLDLRCGSIPKTISDFLTEVSVIDDISQKLPKLNHYVSLLEQELNKIDAFKRELPLCMRLLNNAIEGLKKEVVKCNKEREVVKVATEEFIIPLNEKGNSGEDGGTKGSADNVDKRNWMSSAQLWSTPVQYEQNFDSFNIQDSVLNRKSRNKGVDSGMARNSLFESFDCKNRGGAFIPFKKRCGEAIVKAEEEALPVDDRLSLSMPVADATKYGKSGYLIAPGSPEQQQQQIKKHRRCWSPDLHRRFINALQQLGGAQAATPKQIRELMQVEGLTNDEVKSHLQKYRLHVRKLPSSSLAPLSLGWLIREPSIDLQKPKVGQSGSPEGPLHLGGSAKGASVTGGESLDDEEGEVRKP